MAFGTSTKEHSKNLKLPRQAALQTDPACPMTLNLTSRLKPGQRVPHCSDSLIKLKSDGFLFFFNRHWIITWGRNHHSRSSHSWNELRLTIIWLAFSDPDITVLRRGGLTRAQRKTECEKTHPIRAPFSDPDSHMLTTSYTLTGTTSCSKATLWSVWLSEWEKLQYQNAFIYIWCAK